MRSALTVPIVLLVLALVASPSFGATSAPVNPGAGPDGTFAMHGDSGASDSTPYAGPGVRALPGQPVVLGAVCPTILAGSDGIPQALCTEYLDRAPSLYLLDPTTFLPTARLHLGAGSLLGGVYAYVDRENRLVTVDGSTGDIVWLGHHRGLLGWRITRDREQPVALPAGDAITSVAPGYDGNVWFATAQGRAGYATAAGQVRLATLGAGNEIVANSIATSPSGVAVTTDHATYLLRSGDDAVRTVWRQAYDRGSARKPGQLSAGSGATPTFFGPDAADRYVVITDNARPLEHALVYDTATGAEVCSVPIFSADNSGTENSPIAWGNSIYVASTYGYPYPTVPDGAGEAEPASADFVGGMQRIDLARGSGRSGVSCSTAWTNDAASAAVPRLSRAEGVIYTTIRSAGGLSWSLVRISPETGDVLSQTLLGIGPLADTLQMVGTILPDGTLLQGTLSGLVVVRPRT